MEGAGQRPWHPGRHRAQDRADRRGGCLHATARGRKVRRGLLYGLGGSHGVGASVVNALSSRLDVQVDRGASSYAMSFRRGEPGVFRTTVPRRAGSRARLHPYVAGSQLDIVGNVKAGTPARGSGIGPTTRSSKGRRVRPDGLVARARQTASRARPDHRHPRRAGLLRPKSLLSTTAVSPSSATTWPSIPWSPMSGAFRAAAFHRDGAVLDAKGHMTPTDAERGVGRHCAAVGTWLRDQRPSFVNIIATPKGGTHRRRFGEQALPSPSPTG